MKKKKIVICNTICHHMVRIKTKIKIKMKMKTTVVAVAITMSLWMIQALMMIVIIHHFIVHQFPWQLVKDKIRKQLAVKL